MSLKNHTILVTGGSRGIGRAIVLDLARRGANVAFTYQKEDTCAHETEKLARDLSGYITAYRVVPEMGKRSRDLCIRSPRGMELSTAW